jgi:NAD-dependent dihydropyrimidine dehydrogenase PreA subunit
MTYVITDACSKDEKCVAVCPVDCIHSTDESTMMYVDANECIDCGACVAECDYNAIMPVEDLPADQSHFIQINADFFTRN